MRPSALLRVAVMSCTISFASPHLLASDDRPALGVQVKIETFTPADAATIARTGFGFVRFGVWTDRLSDPRYAQRVSSAFTLASNAKLPVLLTMRSTVALSATDLASAARIEAAGRRFGESVRDMAARHAPQLLGIELWNEPDLSRYWPTGDVAVTFPTFMRGVCTDFEARPLSVPVFGFGFSRAPTGDDTASRLLRTVLTESPHCLRAVSYHAYGMTPSAIRSASLAIRARYGLPAAISEWGVPAYGSPTVSPTLQANRTASWLSSMNALGVSFVSIYEWKDSKSATSERERSFGLIDASGAPKPALDPVTSYFASPGAAR